MTPRHSAVTARLMARFGGTATLTRTTSTAANPWDQGAATTTDYTVQTVETGASDSWISGGLIETGDIVLAMLPHDEVAPQVGDKLSTTAGMFTLLSVEPVRSDPGGPVIHYRLHGRR